ncbi:MAG: class I SAM-dependent methyltransferase [Spirochaetaceae bacterium]|nr:class I SAM-dependent methyltransferase [Spirochaetaceae bacterium]
MTTDVWEAYWNKQDNHDWWKKPAPEVLELIRSLSPVERPRVLDLGCGLGRHAIAFALAQFSVTATDSSTTAIQHVTEWARSLRLPIETRVRDVLDDPLSHETFDVVLSYNVLYHGSRKQFAQAIQHVRISLTRKGLLFFTCPSRRMNQRSLALTWTARRAVAPAWRSRPMRGPLACSERKKAEH